MLPEQTNFAVGVSASDTLPPARMMSGWDMHPTFLSDAELLGASCVLFLLRMTVSRRLPTRFYRKQATGFQKNKKTFI